ncbi:flavin reductase family protein [Streptomyces solicathayae]|uniref:Flavin reductase family protein n=1 Tax=Streptomyces solicathayae TaxID=3081768 RepID=A0ABZ0LLU6_9ACTN|nr:flavin reductase family protein [Streptomyces sp. HUAS YS2]WOX20401.1 flavin reductase family protein [Streptomyces sp. HUAS YS2]
MPDLAEFADASDGTMYVVTAASGGTRAGCLVEYASPCSIDPPYFVAWLSTANRTYGVARDARYLTVHVLGREQRDLAELFGGQTGDAVDKFAEIAWRAGREGSPVLSDVRSWFTGRIERVLPGGDHVGFVLLPVEHADPGAEPPPAPLRHRHVQGLEAGHASGEQRDGDSDLVRMDGRGPGH